MTGLEMRAVVGRVASQQHTAGSFCGLVLETTGLSSRGVDR